ncbi:hypothetical protein L593_14270 [Salinarchaeum sp. Harcht-Bsk1]|uniref:S1 family peptidase n=1 Tax=Salinarchaeum sp. Harcht-Bsk1 TaxID=1333523 RepID=UPI00034238AF|nr:serine protease [Salinarchaeum sp. Harcht-Bsk1]AGN02793.1 hypothetical protein L593_14270 [Salinarchaeum sp. Harcht-Bsk1]
MQEQDEDPAAAVERLEDELEQRRQERRERLSTMPEAAKETAQDVGIQARSGVYVLKASPASLGTAWAVDESHLLTVAHTVQSADQEVDCWTLDGEQFSATVVDLVEDRRPDVGLLETERTLSPLETGMSEALDPEDPLVQVGHPGNFGYWVLAAGPYLHHEQQHSFASEVPILIGNSGSPVLGLDGMVVGISSYATISPEQEAAWGAPVRNETVLHEPVRPVITTYHVPIESALDRMEAWT